MEYDATCLGLKILGECAYDPADPKSYFTLGHLLSVIALLLALSQLSGPIIKFRVRSHRISYKALFTTAIIAIASIFIATVLPFIPGRALPLIGYPIFWELLSAVLFVSAGIYVILKITKPAKFTSKNAEQYLTATVFFIAKEGEERLNELAEEIHSSVSDVVNESRKYNRYQARSAKERKEKYYISDTTRIANTILNAWSDKCFCKSIVCRSPATAIEIITRLAEDSNAYTGRALCNEIINQSFENDSSLLNREEKYSGLGFFKNFMQTCFGEWQFVNGSYRPLQSWRHYKSTLKGWKVHKYCECVEIAFQSYLESKDYWQQPSSLSMAVDEMANFASYRVTNISHLSENEIYESESKRILHEIYQGFQNIIAAVITIDDFPEYDFDEKTYDAYKDLSVFGVVAKGIYEFYENLAMVKGHDYFIRTFAISIWLKIFGVSASTISNNQNEIGKRLLFHIRRKINENLDHEQRWYPSMTKLLLSLNGIYESEANEDTRISTVFHKEFLGLIKEKFPLLYQTDQEFSLDMLPEAFIAYEKDSNKLINKGFRGKITELKLNDITEA